MHIEVLELKLQNFLSYGRDIEAGTLSFENGIDIITAANGSGKSVIVDGLCYAFFGRPYRKIKLSSLQNNINSKELRVEVRFRVHSKVYKIVRGMNPSIFEIYENDVLLEEESTIKSYQTMLEENIICTSEEVFRNLIVLGANIASSKSFLDLSAKEKEEIFNCLIDTKIFQELTDASRRKLNAYKTLNTEYEYKDKLLREFLSSEKTRIEDIKKHNERIKTSREKDILEYTNRIEKIKNDISKIDEVLSSKDSNTSESIELLEKNIAQVEDTIKLEDERISSIKEKLLLIKSAEKTSVKCKNCGEINYTIEIDQNLLDSKKTLVDDLKKSEETRRASQESLARYKEELDNIKKLLLKLDTLKSRRGSLQRELDDLESKLEKVQREEELALDTSNFKEKKKEYEDNKDKLLKNKESLEKYKSLNSILDKDNLRGQVISQAIPFLNREINSFIEKFSIMTFNLVINKDFKESIISRNTNVEFQQLSNGQKSRLSFAILFGFLKLIEKRNSTSWNIILLDEVLDSSLDYSGREDLLRILSDEFRDKKDIIIISHNQEIKEKEELFSREITITKDRFSRIEIKS